MIGKDHIRRLTTVLSGARSSRSPTSMPARRERGRRRPSPARAYATGQELINDDDVDAVVVCSWGRRTRNTSSPPSRPASRCSARSRWPRPRRRAYGSSTPRSRSAAGWSRSATCAGTTRLPRAEGGRGQRRHRRAADRCTATHRNPSVPEHYTREMAITDTAVHDIDLTRWMFGEEIVAARRCSTPAQEQQRRRPGGSAAADLRDGRAARSSTSRPSSTSATATTSAARSSARTAPPRWAMPARSPCGEQCSSPAGCRRTGASGSSRAYDIEFQEWIDGVRDGGTYGPSSWDGYAAAVVSDAAVEALRTGERVEVS